MSGRRIFVLLVLVGLVAGEVQAGVIQTKVWLNDGEGHDTYASTYFGQGTDAQHGNSESVWLGKAGDWRHRAYFKFDKLSTLDISPEQVIEATMKLCVGKLEQPSNSASVPILGFRILEDWTERSEGGVTGVNEPDAEATPCLHVIEAPTLGFHSYDVTELVRGWLADPGTNFGLCMQLEDDMEQTYYYVSSEAHGPYTGWPYHSAENRPYLEITYTAPEPGATVIFILGGAFLVKRRRRA